MNPFLQHPSCYVRLYFASSLRLQNWVGGSRENFQVDEQIDARNIEALFVFSKTVLFQYFIAVEFQKVEELLWKRNMSTYIRVSRGEDCSLLVLYKRARRAAISKMKKSYVQSPPWCRRRHGFLIRAATTQHLTSCTAIPFIKVSFSFYRVPKRIAYYQWKIHY